MSWLNLPLNILFPFVRQLYFPSPPSHTILRVKNSQRIIYWQVQLFWCQVLEKLWNYILKEKKILLQFFWTVSYSVTRCMDMSCFTWDIPRPGHRDSARFCLLEGMSQGPVWHSPFYLSPRLLICRCVWECHSCARDLQTCPSEFVSSKGN